MNKIIIASKSKVKASVVSDTVTQLFPGTEFEIVSVDADSDGPEPVGEEATLNQILTSIQKISDLQPGASFYVGMEGGVRETKLGMEEIAFVIVKDQSGQIAVSSSVSFPISENVAEKVRKGVPFADAVDQIHHTKDIKNNKGFIGLLTGNIIDKKSLYFQPTVVCFSKLIKSDWYK